MEKIFCFGTQISSKFAAESGGGGKGLKIGIWIFFKKSSNFIQQTQPCSENYIFVFGGLGALRLGISKSQDFPSVFEIEKERAVGNLIY